MGAEPPLRACVFRLSAERHVLLLLLHHIAGDGLSMGPLARDIAFARQGPHATILVAEAEGVVLGTCMVGEDGHRGWVYYLAVDPRHQRRGHGRALMAAAEAWLAARGVWKLQLLLRPDNAAVRDFYEHTASWQMEVWSAWSPLFWPGGELVARLWGRRVEQLALPMRPLDVAHGMDSVVTPILDAQGEQVVELRGRQVGEGTPDQSNPTTAPCAAEPTRRAYLPSTPVVNSGGSGSNRSRDT